MAIYEEKRGGAPTGWLIVEVMRDRKRHKFRTTDRREATRKEKEFQAGVFAAEVARLEGYPLSSLLIDCHDLWKGRKDGSYSYRRLELVVDALGPDLLVQDLTYARMLGVQKKLMDDEGLSGSTVNRYFASLTAALKEARRLGRVKAIPTDVPRQKEGEPRKAFLTPDQEGKIVHYLEVMGNHDVALCIRVLTSTGLRIGELLKLTPDDISYDNKTDRYYLSLEDRKNGDDHLQPIPGALGRPLAALLDKGLPDYRRIKERFYGARNKLGLSKDVVLHSLRHTTATRLASRGAAPTDIMEFMGHRSFATTLKYIKRGQEAKQRALEVLMGEDA